MSVEDFDDLSLFLLNIKEGTSESKNLIKNFDLTFKLFDEKKISAKEALLKTVLAKEIPRNDAFIKLYKENSSTPTDMVFILHKVKFKCHQVVFTTGSHYFKSVVAKNNDVNLQQYGKHLQTQTFYVPDWIEEVALR